VHGVARARLTLRLDFALLGRRIVDVQPFERRVQCDGKRGLSADQVSPRELDSLAATFDDEPEPIGIDGQHVRSTSDRELAFQTLFEHDGHDHLGSEFLFTARGRQFVEVYTDMIAGPPFASARCERDVPTGLTTSLIALPVAWGGS
jgi:hypothetical protein